MLRYRPDQVPVEKKSFSGFFFFLGIASLVVAAWVLFNEFETRRPWKKYQSDFYSLEKTRLQAKIGTLESRLRQKGVDPDAIDEIVALDTSLTRKETDALVREQLEKAYGNVEEFNRAWGKVVITTQNGRIVHRVEPRTFTEEFYRNQIGLADLQRMYDEEDGKLRVQKSLRDAEYFRYSEDRNAKGDVERQYEEAVKLRTLRLDTREKAIASLVRVTDEMRSWLAEFQKAKGAAETAKMQEGIAGYPGDVISTAKELADARKQLSFVSYDLFGLLKNFADAKRPQIKQIQLDQLGSTINNVDRCQTCHIAATEPGYKWWLSVTLTVLDDGTICTAVPDEKRPGRFIPHTSEISGDLREVVLPRPIQKGDFWSPPKLYIDGELFTPDMGFRFTGQTIEWGEEFAKNYLSPGRIIEIYQAYPKLYQTHPNREAIFASHPVEKFGCITCHDGQGRALTWADSGSDFRENPRNPASPMYYWEEPVLASLKTLGPEIEKKRAELAAQNVWSIRELAKALHIPVETVLDYDTSYETDKKYRQNSNFHPVVNGRPVGNFAESKCRVCHDDVLELDYAPTLSKAKRLFEKLGCTGCHVVQDYERVTYDPSVDYVEYRRDQVGPSLSYDARLGELMRAPGVVGRGIGWKLNETTGKQWIFNWLKNPRSYLSETRMPNYRLSDDEVKAISAFVLAATGWREGRSDTSVAAEGRGGFQTIAETGGANPQRSATDRPLDPDKIKRGELLVQNIGCLACHAVPGPDGQDVGNSFGPNLGRVGSKVSRTFLETWLRNPRSYDPKTAMPSLFDNVPEPKRSAQIEAITEYLLSMNRTDWMKWDADFEITPALVKQGETLFGPSGYGCTGCHFIEGELPTADGGTRHVGGKAWVGQQIGPELTDFATKTPEFLDYGFARERSIVYYGDRNNLKWGELVRENEDGSVVVRVPKEEDSGNPHVWRGFFFKTAEEVKEITLPAEVPKSITKINHTWHDWAFNKVKEPNIYTTEANASAQKMPNFYLSDDEAATLLVLLKSFRGEETIPEDAKDHLTEREKRIERGRTLTRRYNCVGCHTIEESFETYDGRLVKGWDFGRHTRDDATLPRYPGPDGILGTADDIRQNGWAVPNTGYGRAVTIQPSYDPTKPDAGVHEPRIQLPAEEIVQLNPPDGELGFHSVGNTFTYMRAGYEVRTEAGRDVQVQHGPVLTFAGERFRPDWLFEFLKRPYPVRQYLFDRDEGRMPYFHLSDEEATDLVAYFMALANQPFPYEQIDDSTSPELVEMGRQMFRNEAGCASGSCHPAAEPQPRNLAPDLRNSHRLKPEWIKEWITNPDTFWPGNGMPYFPWEFDGQALYTQYADGDVETQMRALRDYVLTLGAK